MWGELWLNRKCTSHAKYFNYKLLKFKKNVYSGFLLIFFLNCGLSLSNNPKPGNTSSLVLEKKKLECLACSWRQNLTLFSLRFYFTVDFVVWLEICFHNVQSKEEILLKISPMPTIVRSLCHGFARCFHLCVCNWARR